MKQRCNECEVAMEQQKEQLELSQVKQQELEVQTLELRELLQVAEERGAEEERRCNDARLVATRAKETVAALEQQHHEELHEIRVEHQTKMDVAKRRRQQELDDVHAKIKQTVGKKQAAIVELREQLRDAEARAEE